MNPGQERKRLFEKMCSVLLPILNLYSSDSSDVTVCLQRTRCRDAAIVVIAGKTRVESLKITQDNCIMEAIIRVVENCRGCAGERESKRC